MEIIINKDITKYKIEKWKGLSAKQIFVGGGLLVSVGGGLLFFVFICKVPILISSIMITPVAFALVLIGFYEPDGMSFLAYIKKRGNRKLLLYSSIRDEDGTDANKQPATRLQKSCRAVGQIYCEAANSWMGKRILKIGRASVRHMRILFDHGIKFSKVSADRLKQFRVAMEKKTGSRQKKEEEKPE